MTKKEKAIKTLQEECLIRGYTFTKCDFDKQYEKFVFDIEPLNQNEFFPKIYSDYKNGKLNFSMQTTSYGELDVNKAFTFYLQIEKCYLLLCYLQLEINWNDMFEM